MDELRLARHLMNFEAGQDLESRDIFDPASLDCLAVDGPPPAFMCVDDALKLDDGRVTIAAGVVGPAMPWEIIL